jgi:hypothetical protein
MIPWIEFGLYNDLYMGCLHSYITHKDEGHVLYVSQNTCGILGDTNRATWNYTFVTNSHH